MPFKVKIKRKSNSSVQSKIGCAVNHYQYTGDMQPYMILDANLRQAVGSGTVYKVDNQYCDGRYFCKGGFVDSECG
jgi:hypothetical protein